MIEKPGQSTRPSNWRAWFPSGKSIARTLLALVIFALLAETAFALRDLRKQVNQLEGLVGVIDRQRAELNQQYIQLLGQHSNLEQHYTQLNNEYSSLGNNYTSLLEEYQQLDKFNMTLQDQYDGLTNQLTDFQSSAVVPPFISISGRSINIAFKKVDGTIVRWTIPFDRLERELQRGSMTRSGPLGLGMPTIRLQDKSGSSLVVADFRAFIDTGAFKSVMTSLYQEAPDDETFIREVWNLIGQMVTYIEEEDEVPRYPLETLVSGGGDCEDTAILFASMLKAAPVDWDVRFVYMNSQYPTDPQGISDHVIVYVDTGEEKHYIETTSSIRMEPYIGNIAGWYLSID